MLSLVASFCVPVLTYGLNAFYLNKSSSQSLDRAYDSVFFKIFKVKDKTNLALCQFYCGYSSMSCQIDLLLLNFMDDIKKSNISLPAMLFTWFGRQEYQNIANKYNIQSNSGRNVRKSTIMQWFGNKIDGLP